MSSNKLAVEVPHIALYDRGAIASPPLESARTIQYLAVDCETQEEDLRELFSSFDVNRNSRLDYPEFQTLLLLVHHPAEQKPNEELTDLERLQIRMMRASVDTVTTFAKHSGVDFGEFSRFYNHLQQLGIDLETLKAATELNTGENIEEAANKIYHQFQVEVLETQQKIIADSERRRKSLKSQQYKDTTLHTNLVAPYNSHGDGRIDYITLVDSADAFLEEGKHAHYKLDLCEDIFDGIRDHIQYLFETGFLNESQKTFGRRLVDEHDLTAIFAFYKYAEDDVAMATYLRYKQRSWERRRNEARRKFLLERQKSYKDFLKGIQCLPIDKKKPLRKLVKRPSLITLETQEEKKRPKPRWMHLYEDALRRQETLQNLGYFTKAKQPKKR